MIRRRSRHRLVQGLLQAADELVDCNLKTHWCDITLLSQGKQGGKKRGAKKLGFLSSQEKVNVKLGHVIQR